MKKKDFIEALRDFKINSTGAACFHDPVTGRSFCANGLTQEQAEEFAQQNALIFKAHHPGQSCSNVNCN